MLFNSLAFGLFLPVVFGVYWASQRAGLRVQNMVVLAASYVFYGAWDWTFLGLIVLSSAVDFAAGLALGRERASVRQRRMWLGLSMVVNLGILGVFKYAGFFVAELATLLGGLGLDPNLPFLRVALPVGISFYTFQTLSYTIDVYRRHMEPTRDVVGFFAYVAFFPQLVAGPIERARSLLPQFLTPRRFDVADAKDGARQMLWGLFKKVVVADTLAPFVDGVYGDVGAASGGALLLGTFLFAMQIYCDFSGYSDIAIGCARLFGFRLMRNFATPYFARDIGEFWRRWHISLSTWFRDYVYIPLGGSRGVSRGRHLGNLLLTFGLSGFWHGANWTFVFWGLLHGLYYVPLVLRGRNKMHAGAMVAAGRSIPSLTEARQMGGTFALVLVAWVFFRAHTMGDAFTVLAGITTRPWTIASVPWIGLAVVAAVILVEWVQREREHALSVGHLALRKRWAVYYTVVGAILVLRAEQAASFIYFQF